MLLELTDGYKMVQAGEQDLKTKQSLFIDNLNGYKENHQKLEIRNKIIEKESTIYGYRNMLQSKQMCRDSVQSKMERW